MFLGQQTHYYWYDGSLMFYPFNECAKWIVMANPLTISDFQVAFELSVTVKICIDIFIYLLKAAERSF